MEKRLAALCLAAAWLLFPLGAGAELDPKSDLGVSEKEITQKVRRGRLSQDELLQKEKEVSYFTKLKYYLYAKELEPYFEGLEEALRELARSRPDRPDLLARKRKTLVQVMAKARRKLLASGREQAELDWRRGLTGLIWLDQDWRRRVREQGKDEIKNPFDLVKLLDCLDAILRGIDQGPPSRCPDRAGTGTPSAPRAVQKPRPGG